MIGNPSFIVLVLELVLEQSFTFRQGRIGLLQDGISGDVIRSTLPLESLVRCAFFEHEHEHDYEMVDEHERTSS